MMEKLVQLDEQSSRRRLALRLGSGQKILCGIEVGSLESFFSFEDKTLGKVRMFDDELRVGDKYWRYRAEFQLPGAHLCVSENCRVRSRGGVRALSLAAIDDSVVMDCVIRFIIAKTDVACAFIGKRQIPHRAENRYHQFPLETVRLEMNGGSSLVFLAEAAAIPMGMIPVVYLRDERDAWVLHFRVLATAPELFAIKGCHRFYDRPFPKFLQRLATGSFVVRKKLLYVRERVSRLIPFQVNGATRLKAGEAIRLRVNWRWSA